MTDGIMTQEDRALLVRHMISLGRQRAGHLGYASRTRSSIRSYTKHIDKARELDLVLELIRKAITASGEREQMRALHLQAYAAYREQVLGYDTIGTSARIETPSISAT